MSRYGGMACWSYRFDSRHKRPDRKLQRKLLTNAYD